MSQSPITVTYSLEEVLNRLESKIDNLQKEVAEIRQKDIPDLKVSQTEIKTKVESIDNRLAKVESVQDDFVKDIADLKGAKSLIVPIVVAVVTSIFTLLIRTIPK
jgi:archaellum component FlaC